MMPQMPQMPGLPKSDSQPSSGEAQASQAPFTAESAGNSADSDVGLDIPSHVEPEQGAVDPVSAATPSIQVSLQAPANEMKTRPLPTKGIKVVATRKGFYNQMRYKEGEQFIIRSEEDFGEWMTCVDPSMEKKRLEFYKQKKVNQRKA